MKHLIACSFVAFAACGGGSSPGMVDAPPAHLDAPGSHADAPMLTCSPGDPTSCSGENICVGTTCENAFNRIYHFSNIAVVVASQNPGGSAWDPLGGAPDPWVRVSLNGTQFLATSVVSDVFAATYTENADTEIIGGSMLELNVSDSDAVGGDDLILDCTFDPLGADLLRQHIVRCDGTGGDAGSSVTMQIDVKG